MPRATVDLQLEDATTAMLQAVAPELNSFNYEHYFGARESLGTAVLLDFVSRLSETCPDALHRIFEQHLLPRWEKQKTPVPSVSPWKTTLQLQIMVLACEQMSMQMDSQELLRKLHYILSIEPLPRYRYLLSWAIIRIYLKQPALRPRILDELSTKDHHSNPKYLASLMKIGVMVAKFDDVDADFALKLACTFVPLAASSKVVIRHEAQWQVPLLMDYAKERRWKDITSNAAFLALDEYIRSLERFDQPPLERQLDRFNPITDHTMSNLVSGPWYGLDSTEAPQCSRQDFVALGQLDLESELQSAEPCILLGDDIKMSAYDGQPQPTLGVNDIPVIDAAALAPSKAGESRALQTKGTAYLASGLEHSSEQQVKRNSLIVVASLVDNPYNLGGLSRVSEIFGAAEMHLQNQNVTSNRDFSNVAVSSHLHFPIFQLSASAVAGFLAEKKSSGWSIVGIEQTDRSVLLGSVKCKLPEKIVLVIGSEKEGIPALVLDECDLLVEIPQQGITRSLNVQTAAAIVLYEYARQHRASVQG
jgi:tRNA guanosine-2'-O-methyltransferase